LFEDGFYHLLGEKVRIWEIVGLFEVLISEPEGVDGQEKTPKPFARELTGTGRLHGITNC
jgi:hypothetical protein